MNPEVKNKLVFWLLAFLILVNLAMLVSFLILFSRDNTSLKDNPGIQAKGSLVKSLGMSPDQAISVDSILSDYKLQSAPVIEKLRTTRLSLLDELARDNPDPMRMHNYQEEIASLQKQMQKASVDQYLALKRLCTPAQCAQLSALYKELYNTTEKKESGNGHRHRYRWGQRR